MKHSRIPVAVLSVVIVILAVALVQNIKARNSNHESRRFLQQMADNAFRYQLSLIATSFGKDLDEDEASYNQCVAAVSSAASLAELTTFEKQNDSIDLVLDHFSKNLFNPANRETIVQHSAQLREMFAKLQLNPEDAATTKLLSDFEESLKLSAA